LNSLERFENRFVSSEFLISTGILLFFFLSLVQPWNGVSKAFIMALVVPFALWSLISKRIDLKENLMIWVIFILLLVYLAISSLVFSEAEPRQIKRHVKWCFEVFLFCVAVFIVSQYWLSKANVYSNIFLILVLIVSIWAVLGFHFIGVKAVSAYDPDLVKLRYGARLSWFGFLSHPIQGPSVVVSLYTIGIALYLHRSAVSFRSSLLVILSFVSVFVLCFMSGSRGPIGAFLVVSVLFFFIACFKYSRNFWMPVLVFIGVLVAVLILNEFREVSSYLESLISRGDSHRLKLWSAVYDASWAHPMIGFGVATDFDLTVAGKALHGIFGRDMSHSHNIFLHAFSMTGFIGLGMFLLFLFLLALSLLMIKAPVLEKMVLLVVIFSMLLLTATEGYRLVSSPGEDWGVVWQPLFFVFGLLGLKKIDEQSEK